MSANPYAQVGAFALLLLLLLAGFVTVAFNWHTLWTFVQINRSARRMGLRDKGEVEPIWSEEQDEPEFLAHMYCRTHIRVGISKSGPVQYCWRCEKIVLEEEGDDDDDRRDRRQPHNPNPDKSLGADKSFQNWLKDIIKVPTRTS